MEIEASGDHKDAEGGVVAEIPVNSASKGISEEVMANLLSELRSIASTSPHCRKLLICCANLIETRVGNVFLLHLYGHLSLSSYHTLGEDSVHEDDGEEGEFFSGIEEDSDDGNNDEDESEGSYSSDDQELASDQDDNSNNNSTEDEENDDDEEEENALDAPNNNDDENADVPEVNAALQQLIIADQPPAVDAENDNDEATEHGEHEEYDEEEDEHLEQSLVNLLDIISAMMEHPELHTVIFWWACLQNIFDLGEVMLDLGVDMHSADEYGTCGLHLVCSEYSKLSPTSIPTEDALPTTPEWFYPYDFSQTDLLKSLVHAGVNVNQIDKFHRTALALVSLDESTTNLIPNLLQAGATMNKLALDQKSIVSPILYNMDESDRKVLLDEVWKEFGEEHYSQTVLEMTAKLNAERRKREKGKYKYDPTILTMKKMPKPLQRAMTYDCLRILSRDLRDIGITDERPDWGIEEWLAFHLSRYDAQSELMQRVLQQGINLANTGRVRRQKTQDRFFVFDAVVSGDNITALEVLLDEGCPTEKADSTARSSLMSTVARYGNVKCLKLLLERGAEVYIETNLPNQESWNNALYYAIDEEQVEVVRILLDRGIDVNNHKEGISLLPFACEMNSLAMTRLLLDYGAYVNVGEAASTKHRSALQTAAANGHVAIVRFLLQHGADVNYLDKSGLSALDFAVFHQQREEHRFAYPHITRMLLQAGADRFQLPRKEKERRTDYWTLQQLHKYAPQSMKVEILGNIQATKNTLPALQIDDLYWA